MIDRLRQILLDRHTALSFFLTFIPICSIVGFMPYNNTVYYVCLFSIFVYGILKQGTYINFWMLILVCVAIISILWNNPLSIFKAWHRLGLFILVTSVVSPLIQSKALMEIRLTAFDWLVIFAIGIAVMSFFCYFAGINYMNPTKFSIDNDAVGWFGGLTVHSMLLGPIAAIAATCLLWLYFVKRKQFSTVKKGIILAFFCCSCCCVLLTSSRGSFISMIIGIISVLYFTFKSSYSKLLRIGFYVALISVLTFPVYRPFADNLIEKQQSNMEKGGTFSSRADKWNNRIAEFKESPFFGVGFASLNPKNTNDYSDKAIEPGSSWLAIFSMTGLLGGCTVLYILLYCYVFLYRNLNNHRCILYLSLLNVFVVHMSTEGYIFAAGSFMFFSFWLLLGAIYSYKYQLNAL